MVFQPLISAQAGIQGGGKELDPRLGGDEREKRKSHFLRRAKPQARRSPRPSARPDELRSAAVGTGFADYAIASCRFGKIEPPIGAIEQSLIVGGVLGAGGKTDAHRH